jgi:hypothetical protein
MTAQSFGELVAGLKPEKYRRTGEKVWRNSYNEGQVEDRVFRPIAGGNKRNARRLLGAIKKSAKALELQTRRLRQVEMPGCRNGVLGDTGIAVLGVLCDLVNFATGVLEPSIGKLAELTGYSYSAVHDALCRLREYKYLQWIRRTRPTDNAGQPGPQVEQIPNAYALVVPTLVEIWLQRQMAGGPVPDDIDWRKRRDRIDWEDMMRSQPPEAFIDAYWTGDRLAGETLKRIGRMVEERESLATRESGRSF